MPHKKNPDVFEHWIHKYGSDKIILGADCQNEKITISGWQEESTLEVLMLAWMNQEAVERTLKTGKVTYWSRSRSEFWIKGETSRRSSRGDQNRHYSGRKRVRFEGDPRQCEGRPGD